MEKPPEICHFSRKRKGHFLEWAPKNSPKWESVGNWPTLPLGGWIPSKKLNPFPENQTAKEITKEIKIIANPKLLLTIPDGPWASGAFAASAIGNQANRKLSTYQSVHRDWQKASGRSEWWLSEQGTTPEIGLILIKNRYDVLSPYRCVSNQTVFYTRRKWKLINENKRFFSDETIKVTATTFEFPRWAELWSVEMWNSNQDFDLAEVRELLSMPSWYHCSKDWSLPTLNPVTPMQSPAHKKDEFFGRSTSKRWISGQSLKHVIVADKSSERGCYHAVQIARICFRK